MKNNLPIRKNIRINEYDYSKEGYYFITMCTLNKKHILSIIKDNTNEIFFTQIGKIIDESLKQIEKVYDNIVVDEYVIMPNHIHMILRINNQKSSLSISKVIQQFKGVISKKIRYSIWQKSFYEHIIRNEKEYLEIKKYIINNPINWKQDKYY